MFQLVLDASPTRHLESVLQPPLDLPSSQELLHGFKATLLSTSTDNLFRQTPTEYANLTTTQKQLYNWHVHLGHMNYATIQSMACKDLGIPRNLARCTPPYVWNADTVRLNVAP